MRKIILCVLAVMLWSQAVDALECYYCPTGGACFNTATCLAIQDRCITITAAGVGSQLPTEGRRCGTQNECDIINSGVQAGMSATCCAYDRCNG